MATTTKITVKRPDGETEIMDISAKFQNGITDQLFAAMKNATRKAGRGELLSYSVEHVLSATDKRAIEIDNARGAVKAAVQRHDPKAAVAARKRLAELEG